MFFLYVHACLSSLPPLPITPSCFTLYLNSVYFLLHSIFSHLYYNIYFVLFSPLLLPLLLSISGFPVHVMYSTNNNTLCCLFPDVCVFYFLLTLSCIIIFVLLYLKSFIIVILFSDSMLIYANMKLDISCKEPENDFFYANCTCFYCACMTNKSN